MGTLRNPKVVKDNLFRRRDIKPLEPRGRGPGPGPAPASQDSADIRDFIHRRLEDHDVDTAAPPYDSLVTYAYEGDGSAAESLSSIGSPAAAGEPEEDYAYLDDWGPRFKTLAGIFGEKSSESRSQSDSAAAEDSH